jgi:hypothetical protein
MNFMLRTPLWDRTLSSSQPVGPFSVSDVPVLDVHELAAGKLAALFGRTASRDLFDARELLARGGLDRDRLRLGFVVYGGINRRDWRKVSLDDVQTSSEDVDRRLVPMLRADIAPARDQISTWTQQLVAECKELLAVVLPLETPERQFLDALNDRGEIIPDLLTDDTHLQDLIRAHPGLLWKALKVREHFGAPTDETT